MLKYLTDLEKMAKLLKDDDRIIDRLDAVETLDDALARLPMDALVVEFKDVCFRYPLNDKEKMNKALGINDITFGTKRGDSVALVGPTGSGKSTITRLLCRTFEVDSGSVRVAAVDVREVKQTGLRVFVGVVAQETVLASKAHAPGLESKGCPHPAKMQHERSFERDSRRLLLSRLSAHSSTRHFAST